jgi:hypothetical protein
MRTHAKFGSVSSRKANDRYSTVHQPTLGEDTQKLDI